MADSKEFFRQYIEEEMKQKPATGEAGQGPRVNQRPRTFDDGWVDIAPGTPPPRFDTAPAAPASPARPAVNPEVAAALLGAMMNGSPQDLPQQLLRAAAGQQRPQIQPAPTRSALGASESAATSEYPVLQEEVEATTVDTRQSKLSYVTERFKNSSRRAKVISTLGVLTLAAGGSFTGYRAMSDGAVAHAVGAVTNGAIGTKNEKKIILPNLLDCKTTVETLDIESTADVLWKVKMAKVADIEKSKKDKKFKLPTEPAFMAKMELPAVAFPETPEEIEQAKAKTDRYPQIIYRNRVDLIGCDKEKRAFSQKAGKVIFDLAMVSLTPRFPIATDKDAPKNLFARHEAPKLANPTSNLPNYGLVPGEIERIQSVMVKETGHESMYNDHKLLALHDIDKDETARISVRKNLEDYIRKEVEKAAKAQGIEINPEEDVEFNHDIITPGEVFAEGKAPAMLESKFADVQNSKTTITNVKLVGGAS